MSFGVQNSPHMARWRRWLLLSVFPGLLVLALLPLNSHVSFPGLVRYPLLERLQADEDSRVLAIHVQEGQYVRAGQLLLELDSGQLQHDIISARLEAEILRRRLHRMSASEQDRYERPVLEEQMLQVQVDLDGKFQRQQRLRLVASQDGVIVNVRHDLKPGLWVGRDDLLMELRDDRRLELVGYVPEADLHMVRIGAEGCFFADDPDFPEQTVQLQQVSPGALETLTLLEMSSVFGGHLASRINDKGDHEPVHAVHRAQLFGDAPPQPLRVTMPGMVFLEVEPYSLLDSIIAHIWELLFVELEAHS